MIHQTVSFLDVAISLQISMKVCPDRDPEVRARRLCVDVSSASHERLNLLCSITCVGNLESQINLRLVSGHLCTQSPQTPGQLVGFSVLGSQPVPEWAMHKCIPRS